jgi:hypothetical protein
MTHTLHRKGTEENLSNDFVILVMAAKGINEQAAAEKMREALTIASRHNPVNMGDMKTGNIYATDFDEIITKVQNTSIVHAVFTDLDTVTKAVKEIKEADLGISVVLSSTFPLARQCAQKTGVTTHTVEYSLGIWGATEKLPPNDILEITTMCGHGMIASNLVSSLLERIKAGKITAHKASLELAKACECGIFNPTRAEALLEKMAS